MQNRRIEGLAAVGFLALAALAGPAAAQAPADAKPAEAAAYLDRPAWNARPPTLTMKANAPKRLTIHHTAVRANPRLGLAAKLRGLQAFSQRQERLATGRMKIAWADVPYHYYIDAGGVVGEGRETRFVGDTNTNYDPSGHIGIALEGDFTSETPAPAQIAALEALLVRLARAHGIDPAGIGGHKDYASTACPGTNLIVLLPAIRARVAARLAGGGEE